MNRLVLALLLLGIAAPVATALTSANNTPFPSSPRLAGARWISARHGPPRNQSGDILPTPWADDGHLYVLMDDGGTDIPTPGAFWRNSFAQITGDPLHLGFHRIGINPPPATWAQIHRHPAAWTGPLGPYYSTGFAVWNDVFYATQVHDWNWGANAPFAGLAGIAFSTDLGRHWVFPRHPFPGPTGNLNWVQYGRARLAPDGYVYAIATEREFNASRLILGRSRPDTADITNPARWQWAAGAPVPPHISPRWSTRIANAAPILNWTNHITYPRMTYDGGLHRYLLSFTYSYGRRPPGIWRGGAELVVLDSPHPWGPFSFVTRGHYFGPSNGYDPAFPVKWISHGGWNLWMSWAANFDGCNRGLSCAGAYGFNVQQLQLIPARGGPNRRATGGASATSASAIARPTPPRSWRALPATPPRRPRPR
jgi:hypothetical protein